MVADLWRNPITTFAHTPLCTPYTLPAGVVVLASTTQTVFPTAVFSPLCTPSSSTITSSATVASSMINPFYSSTIPIAYTVAGTTVLAWVLLLLLLITPQTRPYLQKLATLSVAISLTVALSECSSILERQYDQAYQDAEELRSYIDGGVTLNIFRVVSYVFLWLAQVQTLIRLFPRHREKKVIKWLGLALMVIDAVFWSLQSFLPTQVGDERSFRDATPALAYLFRIILSLLYCAYVVYYSISKRVYAYHVKNLILALLSLVAVLTPIIFFLLDVSRQWIAGWGDFVAWVGAAAASVVVWEWVERIEYLESKMQETGVLGRQVFEEEMLETGTSRGARASRDGGRSRRRHEGGSGVGSTIDRRRRRRRRVDDGNITGGHGHDSATLSSEHISWRRSRLTRHFVTGANQSDSTAPDNEEENENTRGTETDGTRSARTKEGHGMIGNGLRGRNRRSGESDRHSNEDNESPATSRPRIGGSIMGLLSNARALLLGRPLSRATTGTGATSYRVSSSSIMEDDNGIGDEVRIKHFHPLKRGLSRSSHSSSPASFMNTAELGSASSQLCSRNLGMQSHSPEAESAVTKSGPAIGIQRNSPVPSVSFREDMRRHVAPSSKNPSPLPRVSEDGIDVVALDRSPAVSSRQSMDCPADYDYSVDDYGDDDADNDDDSDYIVYGEAANSETMLRNNQSIHVRAQQQDGPERLSGGTNSVELPPAFDRLPGFNDGDYWDEKDPRYNVAFMNMDQQSGSIAANSPPQTSISGVSRTDRNPDDSTLNVGGAQNPRATLEPADPSSSRRIIERLTGARDWIVTVHNESHDENR
ncbi:PalH/RIM21-domain-containing protein [Lipomyces kononenkoae]